MANVVTMFAMTVLAPFGMVIVATAPAPLSTAVLTRRGSRAASSFPLMTTAVMEVISGKGERLALAALFIAIWPVVADPGPLGPTRFLPYHIHTTSAVNMKVTKHSVMWIGVNSSLTIMPLLWPMQSLMPAA